MSSIWPLSTPDNIPDTGRYQWLGRTLCRWAGSLWLAHPMPLKNPRTHWDSQWDSQVFPLHNMGIRVTHNSLPCTWWRCRHSWCTCASGAPGLSWLCILCTRSSRVRGKSPWTRTSIGSWGRFQPTCNCHRYSTPPCIIGGCAVPPQAAPMLGRFPFLPGWAGVRRGWPWGGLIYPADGRSQGNRSIRLRGRSIPTLRSTSWFDGTPWIVPYFGGRFCLFLDKKNMSSLRQPL